MSWKSIVSAGLLCIVASPAWAVPSLSVVRSYNSGLGVIEWQVRVTQDTATALAIEAPFTLTPVTAGFNVNLRSNSSTSQTTHSSGDNNGAANQTWYYNVDTNGTTLLWNTKQSASDLEQNIGANPFTGTQTEGLWLNTANNRLFAALGSDVNMPDADAGLAGRQVRTLHIASNDGVLNWSNLKIAESGTLAATLSGSFSSIRKADMNGDGVVNGLDVTPFVQALTNLSAYNTAFAGLDGVARADINGDGAANGLDVTPFVSCVTGGGCAPGAGSGGISASVVPEPASTFLLLMGSVAAVMFGGRRRS
jgi:hypothetical protein